MPILAMQHRQLELLFRLRGLASDKKRARFPPTFGPSQIFCQIDIVARRCADRPRSGPVFKLASSNANSHILHRSTLCCVPLSGVSSLNSGRSRSGLSFGPTSRLSERHEIWWPICPVRGLFLSKSLLGQDILNGAAKIGTRAWMLVPQRLHLRIFVRR